MPTQRLIVQPVCPTRLIGVMPAALSFADVGEQLVDTSSAR